MHKIQETVHVMCLTQCTDKQIAEAASIWFAQATPRFKRTEDRRQRNNQEATNAENNPVAHPYDDDEDML
ncbi:hypothetical protein EAI_12681 [Harpegnathos saltator]|uniref:Uncharacterized protein n=1 Tax=Harpegnathos saltator TaxID=610380 RepID=E2BMA8_HARSA|nr:hypothetical protein EAI_12681 [Harpegnathos saltator]